MTTLWIKAGACFMFAGVALGAFGAHALRDKLTEHYMSVYKTAVLYQFVHALALFVVAWLSVYTSDNKVNIAGGFFIAGILLFSGSLFLLAITNTKWLGAITPLGGIAFLIGWFIILFVK